MKPKLSFFALTKSTFFFLAILALAFSFPYGMSAQAPPSAPTALMAAPNSTTRVTLTWTAAVSGGLPIANYRVYRGSSVSSLAQMAIMTKTSYTDSTVSAGNTYYYAVVAADTGRNLSTMSGASQATVPTPPSAPANIVATPISTTMIGLSWSAAASGGLPVASYHVYRGSSASNLTQLAITTKTSFTDTTVSSGNTYYYAVEAVDTGGDLSPMSTVAKATAFTPPSAPAGFGATPLSATRIKLTWSAAASGGLPVKYYEVFRGTSRSSLSKLATVPLTSYTDSSVTTGTTYYYGVEAEDSATDLSPMSAVVPSTGFAPPSAPANVVATPASATKVDLTWSVAASGGLPVLYYQVFRGTSPANLSQMTIIAQTAYMDTSLTPGTTYYYAVVAEDSGTDLSPMSAVVPVTLFKLPSAPASLAAAPASNILAGAAQVTYSASLTWSAAAGGGLPVEFYQVFRGSSPSSLSQVATVTQTFYTDNAVSAVTKYYYAVAAADTGGDLSAMSAPVTATTGGGQTTGLFNILAMNINSFSPSPTNLPGLPTVETLAGPVPSVSYEDGAFLNGKVVYYPWEVNNGGGSWTADIQDGIPQSVALSYNTSNGAAGFSNAADWTYFNLSTLSWYSKGGNQGTNPLPNLPAGFQGGTVAGNMVYPAPIGTLGTGSGGGPYPVLIQYNSLKAFNDPSAYQTFVPPPMNTTMGHSYGWCTAVYDGRFVYYTPLANSVTGPSGNIFRYDTTQPFSNLTTGGVTAAWQNFDMMTGPGNPGVGVNLNAEGFQAAAYDGHRYIYFIPFHSILLVRYDTWNGGSGPDPTGFTVATNYATFDPTQLGTSGYPEVAGQGNTANLAGFTGQQVVWDAANQNEYLYLVPWATYPNGALNPTLQSTAARVRIGTMTGSAWSPVDITSTATSPASSTPDWEMYDLSLLTQNPLWPNNWPLFQPNPVLSTQSAIAGWQEAYTSTRNSSGVTFPPRVGFVPDTSQYLVEHDVGHHLYDPTGWYVSLLPSTYSYGSMGGGYDATNAILYPSSPNIPLYAFQFQ